MYIICIINIYIMYIYILLVSMNIPTFVDDLPAWSSQKFSPWKILGFDENFWEFRQMMMMIMIDDDEKIPMKWLMIIDDNWWEIRTIKSSDYSYDHTPWFWIIIMKDYKYDYSWFQILETPIKNTPFVCHKPWNHHPYTTIWKLHAIWIWFLWLVMYIYILYIP